MSSKKMLNVQRVRGGIQHRSTTSSQYAILPQKDECPDPCRSSVEVEAFIQHHTEDSTPILCTIGLASIVEHSGLCFKEHLPDPK